MVYHVRFGGVIYRFTREAWKRTLLLWARSGELPDFAGFQGVKTVGQFVSIDEWTLADVEQALLDWLRDEREA
jgi:hypothetical protein